MSDPRTIDCELWAKCEAKRLRKVAQVQLVEIRPKAGYRVISGIRIPPNNEMFWPSPPWFYHYAVFSAGLVRDEIYPYGLSFDEYRNKFEYRDAIEFVLRDVGV